MLTTQTRRDFSKRSLLRPHKHARADNRQGVGLNVPCSTWERGLTPVTVVEVA